MSKPDTTAVKDETVQPETVAPAPAAEDTKPEVAEDLEQDERSLEELENEVGAETDSDKDDSKADDTAEKPDAEEPEAQPQGEKLAPKSENRFQKLANENRDLRERNQQLESLKLQESQLASEQELLGQVNPETGDYYTPQEAERLAFAQSREQRAQSLAQERYSLEVTQNQQIIRDEAEKALTEFPIFDDASTEYNPELTAQADRLMQESLIVQNGVIVGSTHSPYQIYKTIADATKANSAQYEANAQKATEKMLANADQPGGASQATKTKEDPMMSAFDEEAAR